MPSADKDLRELLRDQEAAKAALDAARAVLKARQKTRTPATDAEVMAERLAQNKLTEVRQTLRRSSPR
jgi:hypothetical protein